MPSSDQISNMRSAWLLLFALPFTSNLSAADVELVRVWSGPRTAASFERISEYFTGRENPGNQTILRTQPTERAGFYWLIRTHCATAQPSVTIELAVTPPGAEHPILHTLRTTLPAGKHVTLAGLTGSDWPDLEAEPVTWRLRVLAADGSELASEKSYLWTGTSR